MPSIPVHARAEVSLEARLLADRFVHWTRAVGRPVSVSVAMDIVSLVLERAHWFAKPVHLWRAADVYRSLRSTVHNWYALERPGVTEPDDLPEVLWRWFDFLDAEGLFHPDSASVAELREALRCLYFGLGADGLLARRDGRCRSASGRGRPRADGRRRDDRSRHIPERRASTGSRRAARRAG